MSSIGTLRIDVPPRGANSDAQSSKLVRKALLQLGEICSDGIARRGYSDKPGAIIGGVHLSERLPHAPAS